jgi:AcrR family transcriptional regulator
VTGVIAEPRESAARRRVLDTASNLFYTQGVHAVGIDRIIAEAGVAKATFYRHFPAKDDLVRAYLQEQHRLQQQATEQLRAGSASPHETLLRIFEHMAKVGAGPAYRGCPFVNVAAEYPDPEHPARQAVAAYRGWVRELFTSLLAEAGDPAPARTAGVLMLLRDGVVVGSDLDEDLDAPAAADGLIRDAMLRVLAAPAAR